VGRFLVGRGGAGEASFCGTTAGVLWPILWSWDWPLSSLLGNDSVVVVVFGLGLSGTVDQSLAQVLDQKRCTDKLCRELLHKEL